MFAATAVISFCGSRTRPAFHLLFKTYSIQHYGREHHFLWSTIPFFLYLSPSSVILIFFHGTTVDSHPPLIPLVIHPPVQLPLLIPTSSRVRRRVFNSSPYTGNRTVGESATAGKVHAHLNKYQGVEHFAKVNLCGQYCWGVLLRWREHLLKLFLLTHQVDLFTVHSALRGRVPVERGRLDGKGKRTGQNVRLVQVM